MIAAHGNRQGRKRLGPDTGRSHGHLARLQLVEDIIRRLTSERLRTSTWLIDQISSFMSSLDVAASWILEVTDRMRAPLEATQRGLSEVQGLRPPPGR